MKHVFLCFSNNYTCNQAPAALIILQSIYEYCMYCVYLNVLLFYVLHIFTLFLLLASSAIRVPFVLRDPGLTRSSKAASRFSKAVRAKDVGKAAAAAIAAAANSIEQLSTYQKLFAMAAL